MTFEFALTNFLVIHDDIWKQQKWYVLSSTTFKNHKSFVVFVLTFSYVVQNDT